MRLGSARRGGADPMAEPFGARGLLKQYADGVEAASAISARGGSAWCEDGGQSTTTLGGDQSRRAAATTEPRVQSCLWTTLGPLGR